MKIKFHLLISCLTLFFVACNKTNPVIPNEEETITTLKFKLTPSPGADPVIFSYKDSDGDGGNPPVIVNGKLKANTTYTGVLELLNEQETPAEDITKEIKEEDDEHQFFFSTTVSGLEVDYDDQDGDGNPLGLKTKVKTMGVGNGTITIILKHTPDKSASGVKGGDIKNAGGETDISVTFNVTVEE